MTSLTDTPLECIRCVLVNTSHPGNIGSTARALRTMGLRRLVLVAPQAFPHPQASALAAGAQDVLAAAQAGQQVAMLFGNEQSGLSNDEIKHCHAAVVIPTDADYGSLNLAQAVQVIAWELREAWLAQAGTGAACEPQARPADAAQMEAFFAHLARTLDAIDFHKGRDPEVILQRLRRVFLRAGTSERELRVLHGILADAERMARLAAAAGGGAGDA